MQDDTNNLLQFTILMGELLFRKLLVIQTIRMSDFVVRPHFYLGRTIRQVLNFSLE